ncbi:MAG: hypothetical protein JSR58_02050 [Verrucomicrobia bacterium]|nr:hypothetical protein [Verrucomicrobiota bacterium]
MDSVRNQPVYLSIYTAKNIANFCTIIADGFLSQKVYDYAKGAFIFLGTLVGLQEGKKFLATAWILRNKSNRNPDNLWGCLFSFANTFFSFGPVLYYLGFNNNFGQLLANCTPGIPCFTNALKPRSEFERIHKEVQNLQSKLFSPRYFIKDYKKVDSLVANAVENVDHLDVFYEKIKEISDVFVLKEISTVALSWLKSIQKSEVLTFFSDLKNERSSLEALHTKLECDFPLDFDDLPLDPNFHNFMLKIQNAHEEQVVIGDNVESLCKRYFLLCLAEQIKKIGPPLQKDVDQLNTLWNICAKIKEDFECLDQIANRQVDANNLSDFERDKSSITQLKESLETSYKQLKPPRRSRTRDADSSDRIELGISSILQDLDRELSPLYSISSLMQERLQEAYTSQKPTFPSSTSGGLDSVPDKKTDISEIKKIQKEIIEQINVWKTTLRNDQLGILVKLVKLKIKKQLADALSTNLQLLDDLQDQLQGYEDNLSLLMSMELWIHRFFLLAGVAYVYLSVRKIYNATIETELFEKVYLGVLMLGLLWEFWQHFNVWYFQLTLDKVYVKFGHILKQMPEVSEINDKIFS